jgi:hypothetical protein
VREVGRTHPLLTNLVKSVERAHISFAMHIICSYFLTGAVRVYDTINRTLRPPRHGVSVRTRIAVAYPLQRLSKTDNTTCRIPKLSAASRCGIYTQIDAVSDSVHGLVLSQVLNVKVTGLRASTMRPGPVRWQHVPNTSRRKPCLAILENSVSLKYPWHKVQLSPKYFT